MATAFAGIKKAQPPLLAMNFFKTDTEMFQFGHEDDTIVLAGKKHDAALALALPRAARTHFVFIVTVIVGCVREA